MKTNRPNLFQQTNNKLPAPQKTDTKFIYSKQKFSSPQFFLKNPIDHLNINLLSGVFSPQPRGNYDKIQNVNKRDLTAEKKNINPFSLKTNHDSDLTSKVNLKKQITKNDSFYPIKANQPKNHHNFAVLQSNPNQQNFYQKVSYSKHRRIVSEPSDLCKMQKEKKQEDVHKNVRFNDQKIKTNIATLRRQVRKRLQRSNSSSILKNKNRKNRIVSVDDAPRKLKLITDDTASITSDQFKEDLDAKETSANNLVRKKYENIINNLMNKLKHGKNGVNFGTNPNKIQDLRNIKESQKFTDLLFPPNDSSLFGYRNLVQMKQGKLEVKNIKWMRIQQLFPNNQISLYDPSTQNRSQISVIPTLYGSDHLACAMNAIKNCKPLLNKIFQSQTVNQLGIYTLKIFQENIWKHVIIDDKIPVIQNQIPVIQNPINSKKKGKKTITQNQNYSPSHVPAFLNLHFRKNISQIQIWPLLLEKAYANIYSSYETFHIGNQIDYLQEITGTPQLLLNLPSLNQNDQSLNALQIQFRNLSVFALGQKQDQQSQFPILTTPSKGSQKGSLIFCDSKNNFNEVHLPYEKIPIQFTKIRVFSFQKYPYLSHSIVGHYKNVHRENKLDKTQRSEYSLRSFSLKQKSDVFFSIRQKQKRFYENSSFKYDYMWVRVILVQKEYNGDYRWITGKYSCQKSINFETYLSPGQYFLVVMPEWRVTHCHQLNLLIWSNLTHLKIQKKSYSPEQRIIQKACMDLAQRKGKLSQVNAFICSYNYLNEDVGMIIENINNQRTVGNVKVMRSINGLKACVEIIPINKEFYQISEQEKKKNPNNYKNNIAINIPQESSFTVVLKMKGGIDNKFFQVFDFRN